MEGDSDVDSHIEMGEVESSTYTINGDLNKENKNGTKDNTILQL